RPLSSDDEETCEDLQEKPRLSEANLEEKLKDWALRSSLPHIWLKELLEILRIEPHLRHLPKDPRTFLQTPRKVLITPMGSGHYWYNGLRNVLQGCLSEVSDNAIITLQFHVDGLPISRSSKLQLWPILCRIMEKPEIPPKVIAIYQGHGKPSNLNDFLEPFVDEILELIQNGIMIDSKHLRIHIHSFICDSPARAFVKGVSNYNHHSGCTKYKTEGEYFHEGRHMSFYNINAAKRTDDGFRKQIDRIHHKEKSPLEKLPIDMISQFSVADSLHLLDLGVVRKLLQRWVHGSYNFRTKWSASQITSISRNLCESNANLPSEIHREVRGLDVLSYWKGTEFRTVLLYVGIVVFRDFLSPEAYSHFLLLFCATTIYSTNYYSRYVNVAGKMIEAFIQMYIKIYGLDSIGPNVHNLSHILEDVQRFGELPSFSSYPFESFLHQLKQLIRTGNSQLAQIATRLGEKAQINSAHSTLNDCELPKLKYKVNEYHELQNCHGSYLMLEIRKDFQMKSDEKNKWAMSENGQIFRMINATMCNDEIKIYGEVMSGVRTDFFDKPIKSSTLHVHQVIDLVYVEKKLFRLEDLKCKLIRLNYSGTNIFIPLLHTFKTK
uniref:Transposase domain-containing protein n=1 Tax=Phlebotomus papatasi TaxID=29031 RepID=A0A1B0DGN6_PHLPP